jgi:hypothetical protein
MAGRIHGLNEVTIGGSAPNVAIDVTGSSHAGSNRFESPVELATIDVIPGYSYARLGIWRVPLQKDAVGPPVGRCSKEHHPHDPEKKDHQNRNRQA